MEFLADAVTDELLHDAEPLGMCDGLDGAANVAHSASWPHRVDAGVEAALGDIDEAARVGVDLADRVRRRTIAVHAVEIHGDVTVHDVAVDQRTDVTDAVRQ